MASRAEPRPFPPDLPVVDHHCHLSPTGEGTRAAVRFREQGGTHLFVTTQNYTGEPLLDIEAYARQFDITETLARSVQTEAHVQAYVVIAPYPIDLLAAREKLGLERAVELHQAALELAGRRVQEQRAVAIGEVGRPHFAVGDPTLLRASEDLLDFSFGVAKDADCPAIVHCEDLTAEGYVELAQRGRKAGLRPERVIKHYARARYLPAGNAGPTRSYLARRGLVTEVLDDPGPWFLETDYLDDPARPGAVLDLTTVPKRARWIANRFPDKVERLRTPFDESIRKVYGLTLRIPET